MSETSKAYAVAIQHGGRIVSVFTCQQDARDEAASLAEQGEGDFSVFPMAYEPQWIPVSERVPDHTNTVIVSDEHGVWFANRENKLEGWYDTCGGGMMENVTHWMPLPEPPEVA